MLSCPTLQEAVTSGPRDTLRSYQEQALEQSKLGNTIVVLPTGTGKTLIAVEFILYRLLLKDQQPSKATKFAFIAETKVLVNQQYKYISQSLKSNGIVVRSFTGDSEVETREGNHLIDNWNHEDWLCFTKDCTVLCFVPAILCHVFQRGYLEPADFDLIVFDECHHATKSHPMAVVCDHLKMAQYKGRVLGLTASPVLGQKGDIGQKMTKLAEKLMSSTIFSPSVTDGHAGHNCSEPTLLVLRHKC
jgi:endoribonuclease Dicer